MPESESLPEGMAQERGGKRPDPAHRERARDARTGSDAAETRIRHQAHWVDLQIKQAMERGEFDDLQGFGKPLGDLGSPEDRDWWLRRLIERERVTGVLPAALQLRKDDAELEALLDREATEKLVREQVEWFNRRIIEARRQLQGGPPVVTPTRDVDTEVERWRERRRQRHLRRAGTGQTEPEPSEGPRVESQSRQKSRRRWFAAPGEPPISGRGSRDEDHRHR